MQIINQVKNASLINISIDDPFFTPVYTRTVSTTIPDVLSKFEGEGTFTNFERVAAGLSGEHIGPPWYDGLIYECISGISDMLVLYPNEELERRLDGYIGKICRAAQAEPDGYLNTWTQLTAPGTRWGENGGFLLWQHELYNAGAMVEAAVKHYNATGKTALLGTAVKFANTICAYMGPPPKKNCVPCHPLPEEAFVELYRLLAGNHDLAASVGAANPRDYLDMACFWLENRGNHSGEPDWEHIGRAECEQIIKEQRYRGERPNWGKYAQDHMPLLSQREAVGHAVRAALLYAGLATAGLETGREAYLDTAEALWRDMVQCKMHVSGGVGSERDEEKFGDRYRLPEDAYLETCAAVGAVFFHNALFLANPDSKYIDALELAIYNGILVGVSLDGTRYFYENPLASDGTHHRWQWHSCPCCPPMLLKLLGRLPGYIWAHDNASIYVNLYIGSKVTAQVSGIPVLLDQRSELPWTSESNITLSIPQKTRFAIRLRIPYWCTHIEVSVNNKPCSPGAANGYAVIDREWENGESITVRFGMPVLMVSANPQVESCHGKAALQRGPLLYCLEETDNPGIAHLALAHDSAFDAEYMQDLLGGVVVLRSSNAGQPFTAIPFYAWDNRAPGRMQVWLHTVAPAPKGMETLYWYEPCETRSPD